MADYFNSLSDSFTAKTVVSKDKLPLSTFDFKPTSDAKLPFGFGPEAFTLPTGSVNTGSSPAWTFITAPEDISWSIANQSDRVNMFGTNNPPAVAGTKGMRDLSLSNSLVEGFIRGVTVEAKIKALETLAKYKETLSDGFVSVPVYQVWASDKSYGGSNAYFIIKDINIKEKMRDLKGDATRAYVDISFMEVPAYQVNTGRDQASAPTAGAKSSLISDAQVRNANPTAAANDSAKGRANQKVGTEKAASTAKSATPGSQPTSQKTTGTGRKLLPTQLPTIDAPPPRRLG